MKKIFFIAVSAISSSLFAQTEITSIPLPDKFLQGLQTIELGDTLFVSVNEGIVSNNFLIMPDGSQKKFSIPALHNKAILHAENYRDSILFYYGEGTKKSVIIKAVVWNIASDSSRVLPWKHELQNRIWGSYEKSGLHLLCGNKKSDTLDLVDINKLNVTTKKIHIPIKLFGYSTALIPDGTDVSPSQAAAKIKIYVRDSWLIISSFEPGRTTEQQSTRATNTFLKINLDNGSSETMSLKDKSNNYFSTFIHDDLIYKVVKSYKAFTIDIYDWTGKLIKTFTINRQIDFHKEPAYVRDDRARRVFRDRNVLDAIDNNGNEFISVHRNDEGNLILKLGTNTELVKSTPIIGGFGPILLFATAITSATVMLTSNSDTFIDHYFYLKGNVNNGFTYAPQSGLLQQKIDDSELFNKKEPIDYKFKWYVKTPDEVYAFYVMKKGKAALRIVKFAQ